MLSLVDKATKLNRLKKLRYMGTPCEGKINIQILLLGYSKENNMIIDRAMWEIYGLHWKEYIDNRLANCGICTYDVIKLEKSIDKSIDYLEN